MRICVEPEKLPKELNQSHWLKSCPKCSSIAGELVFKLYPNDFGETSTREQQTHKGAQSYCLECRSKKAIELCPICSGTGVIIVCEYCERGIPHDHCEDTYTTYTKPCYNCCRSIR